MSFVKFKRAVTPYVWIFPVISASAWFLMLWIMLIYWLAANRPHYPSMDTGTIAFISDIGAYRLKPFFLTFASITSLTFLLSLLSMRLNQSLTNRTIRLLDLLALLFGMLGCASLVLLAVFDTARHAAIHRLFLLLFMLGLVFSAIFTTLESRRLGRTFRQRKRLRYSYVAKVVLLVLEAMLSFPFGWILYKKMMDQGAVLEWVIAFLFPAYVATFFWDLRPKARTRDEEVTEMKREMGEAGTEGEAPRVEERPETETAGTSMREKKGENDGGTYQGEGSRTALHMREEV